MTRKDFDPFDPPQDFVMRLRKDDEQQERMNKVWPGAYAEPSHFPKMPLQGRGERYLASSTAGVHNAYIALPSSVGQFTNAESIPARADAKTLADS